MQQKNNHGFTAGSALIIASRRVVAIFYITIPARYLSLVAALGHCAKQKKRRERSRPACLPVTCFCDRTGHCHCRRRHRSHGSPARISLVPLVTWPTDRHHQSAAHARTSQHSEGRSGCEWRHLSPLTSQLSALISHLSSLDPRARTRAHRDLPAALFDTRDRSLCLLQPRRSTRSQLPPRPPPPPPPRSPHPTLMSTLCAALTPVATITVVGTASPSAHGHAITSTTKRAEA